MNKINGCVLLALLALFTSCAPVAGGAEMQRIGRAREAAQYERASAHDGIAYDGSYLYVADGRQGLVVLEFR